MILVAAIAVLALASAPAAMAQGSSVDGYGGKSNDLAGVASGGSGGSGGGDAADGSGSGTATATASSDGALPFTGLDVSLLVGGGLLLIGVGVAMAKLVPREQNV